MGSHLRELTQAGRRGDQGSSSFLYPSQHRPHHLLLIAVQTVKGVVQEEQVRVRHDRASYRKSFSKSEGKVRYFLTFFPDEFTDLECPVDHGAAIVSVHGVDVGKEIEILPDLKLFIDSRHAWHHTDIPSSRLGLWLTSVDNAAFLGLTKTGQAGQQLTLAGTLRPKDHEDFPPTQTEMQVVRILRL